MLARILEPEVMASTADAREYDAMDHSVVNAQFVTDLLAAMQDWSLKRPVRNGEMLVEVLDLGTGTAQIPIELARHAPRVHITAVDAAENMLALARNNFPFPFREGQGEGLPHIDLICADAKNLPFTACSFSVVISNSIVHHIAEPRTVLAEAMRVALPSGLQFHRDLARPNDNSQLEHLVRTYTAECTTYQRKLFADSLRAALSLVEIRDLVQSLGFASDTVQMTSDRHWTWTATTKAD